MSGTVNSATNPFVLPNNWILTIPLDELTAAGVIVPIPAGVVPVLASDTPAVLNVVAGTMPDGSQAAVLNALVDGSVGRAASPPAVYQSSITDPTGAALPSTMWFSIGVTDAPNTIEQDINGASHTTQAVPPVG